MNECTKIQSRAGAYYYKYVIKCKVGIYPYLFQGGPDNEPTVLDEGSRPTEV